MAATTKPKESSRTWAETAGAGDRDGAFLGLTGTAGAAVALAGAITLMVACPAIVIYMYVNKPTKMLNMEQHRSLVSMSRTDAN